MERNMEYAHRLYSKNVRIGGKEEYSQVIQINLNNFAFEGNDKIVDKYYIQNEEGIKLNNKLIFIQIYIPNLRKKCYNEGKDNLTKEEKYALLLVEPDVELSKELAEGDILMEDYLKEAQEVSEETGFGESYDKDWAMEDQGRRDGRREEKQEMVRAMLSQGINIELVSKCSGLSIEELKKILETIEINPSDHIVTMQNIKEHEQITIAKNMLKENIDVEIISRCTGLSIDYLSNL